MVKSAHVARCLFGIVAIVVVAALVLHSLNWRRRASVDWPVLCNMLGLLVLAITGAIDPPRGRWRLFLSALALGLIFPSAFVLLRR